MGKLNEYFDRSEFRCKGKHCGDDGGNCGFATVDTELLKVLTDVREHFGKPVKINSGCRCFKHNEEVQKAHNPNYVPGSSRSKHMQGIASDIVVTGVSPDEVADYLESKYPDKYGIGRYNTFTHIDVRSNKARWDLR